MVFNDFAQYVILDLDSTKPITSLALDFYVFNNISRRRLGDYKLIFTESRSEAAR